MIFYSKLAKLGKAENVNCTLISINPHQFVVAVGNKKVELKTLNYSGNTYLLSPTVKTYNYQQVIALDSQYAVALNNNFFSIIRLNYGT